MQLGGGGRRGWERGRTVRLWNVEAQQAAQTCPVSTPHPWCDQTSPAPPPCNAPPPPSSPIRAPQPPARITPNTPNPPGAGLSTPPLTGPTGPAGGRGPAPAARSAPQSRGRAACWGSPRRRCAPPRARRRSAAGAARWRSQSCGGLGDWVSGFSVGDKGLSKRPATQSLKATGGVWPSWACMEWGFNGPPLSTTKPKRGLTARARWPSWA